MKLKIKNSSIFNKIDAFLTYVSKPETLLILSLEFNGVAIVKDRVRFKKLYLVIMAVFTILPFTSTVILFFEMMNLSKTQKALDIVIWLLYYVIIVINSVIIIVSRESIYKLLFLIRSEYQDSECHRRSNYRDSNGHIIINELLDTVGKAILFDVTEHAEILRSTERLIKFFKWMLVAVAFDFIIFVGFPLIVKVDNKVIFIGWYPWSLDNSRNYYFTYLLNLIVSLVMQLAVIAPLFLQIRLALELEIRNDILMYALKNIGNRLTSQDDVEDSTEKNQFYQNLFQQRFVKCVQYHQIAIRYTRLFTSIYKHQFSTTFFFGIPIFAINITSIMAADDITDILQKTIEMFALMVFLFIPCAIGERIEHENISKLQLAMYDINWVHLEMKLKQQLLIMLTAAYRSPHLKISPNYIASYATIAAIIKAAYSYANILLQNMQRPKMN